MNNACLNELLFLWVFGPKNQDFENFNDEYDRGNG